MAASLVIFCTIRVCFGPCRVIYRIVIIVQTHKFVYGFWCAQHSFLVVVVIVIHPARDAPIVIDVDFEVTAFALYGAPAESYVSKIIEINGVLWQAVHYY